MAAVSFAQCLIKTRNVYKWNVGPHFFLPSQHTNLQLALCTPLHTLGRYLYLHETHLREPVDGSTYQEFWYDLAACGLSYLYLRGMSDEEGGHCAE